MNNITLDAANFSEQLGLYDFFNVIISGAVFVFGLCVIKPSLYSYLFNDIEIPKGLGIVLFIYITGLILQEIAYWADKKTSDIYKKMNRSIIKDKVDENGERKLSNEIIDNPLLIEHYRKLADSVLCDLDGVNKMSTLAKYDNEDVNGFFFSVCQYYVAVNGKDKKVEKMRALFNMSKILTICFVLLAITNLVIFFIDDLCVNSGVNLDKEKCFVYRIIIFFIFVLIAMIFYYRTKRTMRYFLLILLGMYDAIVRLENKTGTNKERKDYLTQKEYENIKELVNYALNENYKSGAENYIRRIESYGYNLNGKTSYVFKELVFCVREASGCVPDKGKRKYYVRKKMKQLEKNGVRWDA